MVWFCRIICCCNSSKASIVTILDLFFTGSSIGSSNTISGSDSNID
ncbi:16740_t:CDS:1, partial [Gigaspora margarita]